MMRRGLGLCVQRGERPGVYPRSTSGNEAPRLETLPRKEPFIYVSQRQTLHGRGFVVGSRPEFLQVDQVVGGGNSTSRNFGWMSAWLARNNYPAGFQILCASCKLGKRSVRAMTPPNRDQKSILNGYKSVSDAKLLRNPLRQLAIVVQLGRNQQRRMVGAGLLPAVKQVPARSAKFIGFRGETGGFHATTVIP
jgi:hypothetical protein